MAIAVNGGHVSRALDFYGKEGKYFIIGGSKPWENEPSPELPKLEDFKLKDVIGLKKIDNTFLVVPDDVNGTIVYRDQKWRVVTPTLKTKVAGNVVVGSRFVMTESTSGFTVGSRVRINNTYEGVVVEIRVDGILLDEDAPENILEGGLVEGGALVEGAKYVYVEGYLDYDNFPLASYRQIGLCTGVVPKDSDKTDVLRSEEFNPNGFDEFNSLGILEVLDNRAPISRDLDMRELLSMILEF